MYDWLRLRGQLRTDVGGPRSLGLQIRVQLSDHVRFNNLALGLRREDGGQWIPCYRRRRRCAEMLREAGCALTCWHRAALAMYK